MKDKRFLKKTGIFHGRSAPEEGIQVMGLLLRHSLCQYHYQPDWR